MEGQRNNSYSSGEIPSLNQHDAVVREASLDIVAGQSTSRARLNNIDLNASYEDYLLNANQERGSASDHPLLIRDRNEDSIHLSSIRRAVELSRQLTVGNASSSNSQARNFEQLAGYFSTNIAREQQNYERNVRQRTDGYFSPANLNSNAWPAHVHNSDHQPTAVFQNGQVYYQDVDPLRVAPPSQPPTVHRTRLFAQSLTAPANPQQQEPINVMLPPQPGRQNYLNTVNDMSYAYPGAEMANHFSTQMPFNYQPVFAPYPVAPQIGTGVERQNYLPGPAGQAADFLLSPPEFYFDRTIIPHELRELLMTGHIDFASSLLHGGHFHHENVVPGYHSGLFDQPEYYDGVHEALNNMPLDLEEVLREMQERNGLFEPRMTEDHVLPHLRQRKYKPNQPGMPAPDENCCICQEQYVAGEDITSLQCRHYFHVKCITEWLVRKNSCPICKATGLVALVGNH